MTHSVYRSSRQLVTPVRMRSTCCSRFKDLVIRICRAIGRFFYFIFCCGRRKPDINLRDKRLLTSYHKYKTMKKPPKFTMPPLTPKASSQPKQKELEVKAAFAEEVEPEEEVLSTRGVVVKAAKRVVRNGGDILFDRHAKSRLEEAQRKYDKLPDLLKEKIRWVIPLTGRGAKQFVEEFAKEHTDDLKRSLQQSLKWLLHGQLSSAQDQEIMQVTQKIISSLKRCEEGQAIFTSLHARSESVDIYIKPILCWLISFQEAQTKQSFDSLFPNVTADVVNPIKEYVFTYLLGQKIDEATVKLHQILGDRLPNIVQDLIRKNAAKLTDYVANRWMNLLEGVKFKKLFDKVVAVFNAQMSASLLAEKAASEVVLQAKNWAAQKKNGNAVGDKLSMVAADLEKLGHQVCHEKLLLSHFSQQKICHPRIQQLIKKNTNQPPDFNTLSEELKSTLFFTDLAEKMVSLLFPSEQHAMPDGSVRRMEGLGILWNQLEIPKECKELISYIQEMGKQILLPSVVKGLDGFSKSFFPAIEKQSIAILQEKATSILADALQKQFAKLVLPKNMKQKALHSVLPALHNRLYLALARKALGANLAKVKTLFCQLILNESEQKEIKESIIQKWYVITKEYCITYKMPGGDKVSEEFRRMIDLEVDQIEEFLSFLKEKLHTFSEDEVLKFLQKYFNPEGSSHSKEEIRLYGDLCENLFFRVGNFRKKKEGALPEKVIERVLNNIASMRTSPDTVMTKLAGALERNYGERQAMENALFGAPAAEISEEQLDKELEERITPISQMIYDIFKHVVQQSSFLGNIFASTLVGSNAASVKDLIKTVSQKCFGNTIFNANLFLQIQEVLISSFSDASAEIRESQALQERRQIKWIDEDTRVFFSLAFLVGGRNVTWPQY